MTTPGIAEVVNAAAYGSSLKILNIAENTMRDQDYVNISEALDTRGSRMCGLQELHISSHENGWEGTSLLFKVPTLHVRVHGRHNGPQSLEYNLCSTIRHYIGPVSSTPSTPLCPLSAPRPALSSTLNMLLTVDPPLTRLSESQAQQRAEAS